MNEIDLATIERSIYVVRGLKVMLDSDLAKLYGVETKALNQAVKRNIGRFPEDFMFQCNSDDLANMRSQFVTSYSLSDWNHMRGYMPLVFTENGVAMLSSVLRSEQAIRVNIAIMRIFTKLRSFLLLEENLNDKIEKLEDGTNKMFKVVFERLDQIDEVMDPRLPGNRRKIGMKKNE